MKITKAPAKRALNKTPHNKQKKKAVLHKAKRHFTTSDPFAAAATAESTTTAAPTTTTAAPRTHTKTTNQFIKRGNNHSFAPRAQQGGAAANAAQSDDGEDLDDLSLLQNEHLEAFNLDVTSRQPVGKSARMTWHVANRSLTETAIEQADEANPADSDVDLLIQPEDIGSNPNIVYHGFGQVGEDDHFRHQARNLWATEHFSKDWPKLHKAEELAQMFVENGTPAEYAQKLQAPFLKKIAQLDELEAEIDENFEEMIESDDFKLLSPNAQAELQCQYGESKVEFQKKRQEIKAQEKQTIGQALVEYGMDKEMLFDLADSTKPTIMDGFLQSPGFLSKFGKEPGAGFEHVAAFGEATGRKTKASMKLPRVDPSKKHLIPEGFAMNQSNELVPKGFANATSWKYADPELYLGSAHDKLFNDLNDRFPEDFKMVGAEREKFMEYTSSGQHFMFKRDREKMLKNNSVVDEVVAQIETRYKREKPITLTYSAQNVSPFKKKYYFDGKATAFAYMDIKRNKIWIDQHSRPQHKNHGPSMDMSFLTVGYYKATH